MQYQREEGSSQSSPLGLNLDGQGANMGEDHGGETMEQDDYHNAILGTNTAGKSNDNTSSSQRSSFEVSSSGFEQEDDDEVSSSEDNDKDRLSKPNKQSGKLGASANLINSIVGAGIIGIPYALRQSGLVAGVILLILVSYLTDKSLRTIVGLASFHPTLRSRNVRTFEDLASYPFGNLGSSFILLNMFILAYGAMVAYLLIIKDTVPAVLLGAEPSWIERTSIMFATSLLIMVPLSMQRDMASLACTSFLSVSADIALVVFIAIYSPIDETVTQAGGFSQILKNHSIHSTLFIGLGILSTAMACQHSAFIVSGSLRNKTMRRWAIVTGSSIFVSMILCAILGISGYLGFLNETQGDVLNNFNAESSIANGARILLAITMFFTYPMESFVARHVLVMLCHNGDMDGKDDPNYNGTKEAGGILGMNRRQAWTLGIYLLTLIPAIIVDDLGPVLSITGSLGGSCISYIAPGLVYLGVNGDAFLSYMHNLTNKNSSSTTYNTTMNDLPIEGDANQILPPSDPLHSSSYPTNSSSSLELPVSGSPIKLQTQSNSSNNDAYCKPLWYYFLGIPIWCSIASHGSQKMKQRIDQEDNRSTATPHNQEEQYIPPTDPNNMNDNKNSHSKTSSRRCCGRRNSNDEIDIMLPSGGEYCMAIFFIVFGAIAAFAGVTSNIYAQIKGEEEFV
mmetsp:Transcript_247/g.391  ORF Transcript_247/g.391 Transcript_247/m.391 type:complete len:680 (+) Transcript_247:108-2147(+)